MRHSGMTEGDTELETETNVWEIKTISCLLVLYSHMDILAFMEGVDLGSHALLQVVVRA